MLESVQSGAQRIAVEVRGAGPPVLLLHSSGMSSQQWRRLGGKLADRYRVLAPDLIGYGQSDAWRGEGEPGWKDDLAAAEAVAAREDRPVRVAGHSYGGFLALMLAARGQVPVASVAVFDPVAFGVLHSAGDTEALGDLAAADADGRLFAPERAGTREWMERFVNFWGGSGYWDRLPEPQRAAMLASDRKTFQEVRSLSFDRTPLSAFAAIGAPTLLITGERSPRIAGRIVSLLATVLPQAQVAVVAGAGHMGPLTHGEKVNALISGHFAAE